MDLGDFNNLRFIARIMIEKSKDPAYDDKNKLEAVTPDHEGLEGRRAAPCVDTDGLAGRGGGGSTGPGCGSWQARAGHCKAGLGAEGVSHGQAVGKRRQLAGGSDGECCRRRPLDRAKPDWPIRRLAG